MDHASQMLLCLPAPACSALEALRIIALYKCSSYSLILHDEGQGTGGELNNVMQIASAAVDTTAGKLPSPRLRGPFEL